MRTARLHPPTCPEGQLEEFVCPACGNSVEVDWRDWVDTTSGPAELVRIRCANRHWFMTLAENLQIRTDQ